MLAYKQAPRKASCWAVWYHGDAFLAVPARTTSMHLRKLCWWVGCAWLVCVLPVAWSTSSDDDEQSVLTSRDGDWSGMMSRG